MQNRLLKGIYLYSMMWGVSEQTYNPQSSPTLKVEYVGATTGDEAKINNKQAETKCNSFQYTTEN